MQALVDQTKQMGAGMNQAAGLLMSIKRDASAPSMAGMYVPPQLLTTDDFKNAAKLFISPDGHSARYLVETRFDPFSTQAMDQVQTILDTARGAQPNTSLSDATISMVGTTPMYSTIRSYYEHDLRVIIVLTLAVVFLILVALLRAIVAPLYLIASVVISYLAALGLGVAFFQFVCHQQIYWNVPATAFIVLVAVGADYNLLLITRIREEATNGIRSGIIRAVRSTGGVITSAGIIFAASMFGLLFGSVSTMVQTGFIIGAGLLIDTFVVRTITVPAMAALVGRANWWPGKAALSRAQNCDEHNAHNPMNRPLRELGAQARSADPLGNNVVTVIELITTKRTPPRESPHRNRVMKTSKTLKTMLIGATACAAIAVAPTLMDPPEVAAASDARQLKSMMIHGDRVAYRDEGAGEVLLLIHGMGGSSQTWRDVIPMLAKKYRVIAPDLLGHGQSDKPRGDYSVGAFAVLAARSTGRPRHQQGHGGRSLARRWDRHAVRPSTPSVLQGDRVDQQRRIR